MSLEIYAQRFRAGQPQPIDRDAVRQVIGEYLAGEQLIAPDGSTAQVLGLEGVSLGLCFVRPERGLVMGLIVKAAAAADLVLTWPCEKPVFALSHALQAADLPEPDWECALVADGRELEELIEAGGLVPVS